MLICGRQSIVDVTTAEIVPAEDGPSLPAEFKVHVESFGLAATRMIRIEQRDARTFVSHLRAVERVRQAAVTLVSTPPDDFQLRIGFVDGTGRAVVSGRLTAATEAGLNGACLLGEMPHIFAQVPFPKASLAILEAFTTIAGIELDLTELAEQAKAGGISAWRELPKRG